ncbi:MAG: CHAT domain-containing protein [Saprospiraceae bacterium]
MKNYISAIILCLLFSVSTTKLLGQLTFRDSIKLEFYQQKVKKYTNLQLDTALIYSDSLIELATDLQLYKKRVEALLAKIDIAFYKNDAALVNQFIETTKRVINEDRITLGSYVKDAEHSIAIHTRNYYTITGQNDKAEKLYRNLAKELESLEHRTIEDNNLLIQCYTNIGTLLQQKGSYRPALDYYHKAETLGKVLNKLDAYVYLAYVYQILGEAQLAKKYTIKFIDYLKAKFESNPEKKRNDKLIHAYYNLYEANFTAQKYEEALVNLNESLKYHLKKDPFLPYTYKRFGKLHTATKDYNQAIRYFERSLKLMKKEKEVANHFEYANPLSYIGDVHFAQKNYKKALAQYQLAITNIVLGFKNLDYRKNPKLSQVDFKKELLALLGKKANCFYQLTLLGDREEDFAQLMESTNGVAMNLLDSISLDYTVDADKQFLLEQSYAIYEIGIDLAMHQGNVDRAFMLSEQSKAMVLSEGINRKRAQLLANIDDDKRAKLQKIEKEISTCNIKMQKASDEATIAQLRDEKFALTRAYQNIIEQIETNESFQAALANKHDFDLVEIKAALKKRGMGILEFFEGEQCIFAFYLDPVTEDLRAEKIPKTESLSLALKTIVPNLLHRADELYLQQASLIYDKLLAPLWGKRLPERLVIIPDGILGSIPYNVLLTEKVGIDAVEDFANLPYLFYQTSLSMAFSAATLLNHDLQLESEQQQAQLIAYAPSFRATGQQEQRAALFATADRASLMDLVFNKAEVNALEKNFICEKVMNEEATKLHFLEHAVGYRNAHIAAHAQVNIDNSDMSFIAFSNVLDTTDQHYKLTVDELYGLHLPMNMIVLSACETGVGKAVKGEGIISIARGFAYAGVRSIVTTLWNVNDLSTSILVGHFYERLDQRAPKDIALQNSMQDYLQNPEIDLTRKHPKYWAAFTVIGNTEAILLQHPRSWFWYVGFLAVLGLLGWGFARWRRTA